MNGRQKLILGCVASGAGLLAVMAIGDLVTGGDLTRPTAAPTVTVTVTVTVTPKATATRTSEPKPEPKASPTPSPTATPTRSRPATGGGGDGDDDHRNGGGGGRPAVGFGRSCAPVGALATTLDGRPAKCFMGRDGHARWGYDSNRG
ncbi:hypothetical protein ABZ921_22475 [Streptomyces atriruber]|uniref:Uncharacterized protein n=1 Tax=Streptomyces atriruber TaxID=545121 RepID=A0ABV3BQV5_9ACTN